MAFRSIAVSVTTSATELSGDLEVRLVQIGGTDTVRVGGADVSGANGLNIAAVGALSVRPGDRLYGIRPAAGSALDVRVLVRSA